MRRLPKIPNITEKQEKMLDKLQKKLPEKSIETVEKMHLEYLEEKVKWYKNMHIFTLGLSIGLFGNLITSFLYNYSTEFGFGQYVFLTSIALFVISLWYVYKEYSFTRWSVKIFSDPKTRKLLNTFLGYTALELARMAKEEKEKANEKKK